MFQLVLVKVRLPGLTVAVAVVPEVAMMVTSAVGWLSSVMP